MKKRVCGILSLFICFGAVYGGIQIRFKGGLQGKEEDTGRPVMVVAQGDEYSVQVVCDSSTAEDVDMTAVEKIPGFSVSRGGTGSNMTMINGRTTSTTTHTYRLQPLETGFYTIGPVTASSEKGEPVVSNSIHVRVVAPGAYDQFAGKKGAARQALKCTLSCDPHEIYVGQQATVTVTIEDDGQVHERSLQPPVFAGGLKGQQAGAATSEQKLINGQLKVVITQKYAVTADAPGTYTIEPAVAQFIVPEEEREEGFGFLSGFFGPSGKKKMIRSNSSIISIKPLPLSEGPVDAVGSIDAIDLKPAKSVLDLNEPCIVTFTVAGACNFDALTPPQLHLADALSVYPSTNSYKPDPAVPHKGIKSFEYLIQVGEAGEHEVAAQPFVYFDVETGAYRTLYTKPFTLQVKPPRSGALTPSASPPAADRVAATLPERSVITPLQAAALPVIPLWALLLVVLLGFGWIFRDVIKTFAGRLLESVGITSSSKREKAVLDGIIERQAVEELHAFFLETISRRLGCDSSQCDNETIRRGLIARGLDDDGGDEICQYLDGCSQAAFTPHMIKESFKTSLLNQAPSWFKIVCYVTEKAKK